MQWKHIDPEIEARLALELYSWRGTPYLSGSSVKRVGVDCARFICAVLDRMYNLNTKISTLPCDRHLHDPESAIRALKQIMALYPHEKAPNLTYVEPGDILVVGTKEAPGHAMVVGPKKNQLWHQDGSSVCMTPPRFGFTSATKIYRIYRPVKDNW